MAYFVFVKSIDGKVLYPTNRCGHVRWLLKTGKAKVIQKKSFQIQLLYKEKELYPTPAHKKIVVGIDPGRQNIGSSAVCLDGNEVYSATVQTRNKEIPDLMKKRKTTRHARRAHQRLTVRRKVIAEDRKLSEKNLLYKRKFPREITRLLPGCEKPIVMHDIKNSEARFLNRKREKGWVTPSAEQLIRTHINLIREILKLLPIHAVAFELNKFAFMKLENKGYYGIDFQNGRLKNYKNVREYIENRQGGLCCICNKNKIEDLHHICPRRKGGSDLPATRS